jgi:hypothetical protein
VAKSADISNVIRQNAIMEEKRKDQIRAQQKAADDRQTSLNRDKTVFLQEKRKQLQQKEEHSS